MRGRPKLTATLGVLHAAAPVHADTVASTLNISTSYARDLLGELERRGYATRVRTGRRVYWQATR